VYELVDLLEADSILTYSHAYHHVLYLYVQPSVDL
jgi:hypothetical protein